MKKQHDSFSKYITISIVFHLIVLVFLTVRVLFFPDQSLDYQKSVRIDVVALPDKIQAKPAPEAQVQKPEPVAKKEEAKPKKTPKPKPEKKSEPKKVVVEKPKAKKKEAPKPKKEEVVENSKEEQDSAIARLKAMQKLRAKQAEEETQKQDFKGNAVSKGNALTGLEKLQHESYLSTLDSHIRNHWNLPEFLAVGNLKASVLLLISKDGTIRSKSFIVKSGNSQFDQHVLGTLEKANPLPAPPKDLVDFFANKGVEIRFPE